MNHAYRSEYDHVVGSRIATMRETHNQIEPIRPNLREVQRARIARTSAGAVGLLGVLASCVVGVSDAREELTYTFLGSLVAMAATYLVTRVLLKVGSVIVRKKTATTTTDLALPQLTGRVHDDLMLLESNEPLMVAEKKLARMETYSTALPLAALSFLVPLTLHFLFTCLINNGNVGSFSEWIRISFVVTGHAHLALAILAIRFAQKLRRMSFEEIQAMSINREWVKIWGIVIGVSCVPFILLFAVPPILVAVTGIAFIPIMFAIIRQRLVAERSLLAMIDPPPAAQRQEQQQVQAPLFVDTSWTDLMRNPSNLTQQRVDPAVSTTNVRVESPLAPLEPIETETSEEDFAALRELQQQRRAG